MLNASFQQLEGFKKRFTISSKLQHGEAASTGQSADEEMKALQTVAGEYQEEYYRIMR
jgi:hypothetical protein